MQGVQKELLQGKDEHVRACHARRPCCVPLRFGNANSLHVNAMRCVGQVIPVHVMQDVALQTVDGVSVLEAGDVALLPPGDWTLIFAPCAVLHANITLLEMDGEYSTGNTRQFLRGEPVSSLMEFAMKTSWSTKTVLGDVDIQSLPTNRIQLQDLWDVCEEVAADDPPANPDAGQQNTEAEPNAESDTDDSDTDGKDASLDVTESEPDAGAVTSEPMPVRRRVNRCRRGD